MRKHLRIRILFVLITGFMSLMSFGQSPTQKKLEAQRQQYLREIKQMEGLLNTDRQKQKSIIDLVENLNYKVSVRQNLIKVTNDQVNYISRQINNNQNKISELRAQLDLLKKDYAQMLVRSYKNKSDQSRIMFLLSSENFKQAYKRFQYLQQYREYQQKQADEIREKTTELQELNLQLLKQKEEKSQLVIENRAAKKQLQLEKKQQEEAMAALNKNMTRYAADIRKKRQEIDRIDAEIDRLIKAAIVESNKKAGNTKSTGRFVLTPEGKKIAADFAANKGNLPWPVSRGVIKSKYGIQPSLTDRTVKHKNYGVIIATDKNEKVKAVFDGVVSKIMIIKRANPVIMIRHGDYLTVYKNLSKVYVKSGDRVSAGQDIGEVFTNKRNNETMLGFGVYRNGETQNPEYWLARN
jgi:septal ring factor EnvC (AmiA/AmiB activator)